MGIILLGYSSCYYFSIPRIMVGKEAREKASSVVDVSCVVGGAGLFDVYLSSPA